MSNENRKNVPVRVELSCLVEETDLLNESVAGDAIRTCTHLRTYSMNEDSTGKTISYQVCAYHQDSLLCPYMRK